MGLWKIVPSIKIMAKLAFYTCFTGNDNNIANKIPPLPSLKYPCYYFTNNLNVYQRLEKTSWRRIFMEDVPIYHSEVEDAMSCKRIRTCPHLYEVLKEYEYLCYFDSKISADEKKVEEYIEKLSLSDKCLLLYEHPHSSNQMNVWDEFNLSMDQQRYILQKERYKEYIHKQLSNGYSEEISLRPCGGFVIRKQCEQVIKFNETWYRHIQECGIQDQISLQFVCQDFKDVILSVKFLFFS